ncbi:DUF881 domain-containing protein [Peribacillus butanolivorans]|uniref:DUF881 domain-containing protein n=1 Tax=Peribacillus butanolivorans TaxID=421767 RepID=A0AAX0S740_9BACI|nr:DUF881 domain-containing protein [Peribacillus butanolivorans]AXN40447.1 DUF881 domain-containing protein [Peribacillus butanolivorans]MCO0596728.1 DUF881 domain-containing protein [Peribacillus butanolivorans]MED3691511.1 DUF881 domain-containing protein [Peribacillus butanolivorans]PEJ35162.1 hypothetical protein CN689_07550 [Peribacillus butanolivorans]QNU05669.1 DUF881 domain-containing protein [Peribacillus butanolivorans]
MRKINSKQVILSLVSVVLGFMIAFSYNLTKDGQGAVKDKAWDQEYELRQQLIEQEKQNRELQKELLQKQAKVSNIEKDLAQEKQLFFNLAKDTEKYRMYLGKVKVKGTGLQVTLEDGSDMDSEANVNNYLVHEQHVFKVVNELYISGAEAVAINGQRLDHDSYIVCNGPVITIDGHQHPAPFIISAIGDPDILEASLDIPGGIKEQLVNENVIFTMEKQKKIIFDPIIGG